jgi:hypothetical protein
MEKNYFFAKKKLHMVFSSILDQNLNFFRKKRTKYPVTKKNPGYKCQRKRGDRMGAMAEPVG